MDKNVRELLWPNTTIQGVQGIIESFSDESSGGKFIIRLDSYLRPDSQHVIWNVFYDSPPNRGCAVIDAYQLLHNVKLKISDGREFLYDGYGDREPIGTDLWELVEKMNAIEDQQQTSSTPTSGEQEQSVKPTWLPKGKPKQREWKNIYSVIQELREEYKNLYFEGNTDNPEPRIDDIKVKLTDVLGAKQGKYGDKTLKRIMEAGDNGWLEGLICK